MAGLPSLMNQPGQAPQPGQAAPPGQGPMQPGMAPQQGAQTPGGVTGGLSELPPEQLLAMYNNPQDTTPKLSVAGAYAQAVEQERLLQMAAGQTAMAQNARQQMPVVQELMSQPQQPETPAQEPVMAAFGGLMQGYAGGGAVAFTKGGNPGIETYRQNIDEYRQAVEQLKAATQSGDTASAALYAQKVQALRGQLEPKLMQAAAYKSSQAEAPGYVSRLLEFGIPEEIASYDHEGRVGLASKPIAPAVVPPALAPSPAPAPAAPRRQPMAGPAPAAPAAQPALAPSANLSPEMEAYFRNRQSDLRTRQGLPEDIVAGRAGLEALARESIAAQRGEAETFGREARERRDAALARAQRGILDDPQALLALAGSIDTRKGQGIGSLARGAAGLMGQREAAAEAAREKYATAQQTERALQANVRQSTMLEAQRAQALREGDFNRANQIKDQIDALMMQRETLLMERRDKAIEQSRLERGLDIQERGARAQERAAGRPNELELAMSRPEDYKRILAARAEAQQLRKSPEEVRAAAIERYADNWEKLDMLQKGDLAKQGITNFQQYVRMRDQMAGVGGASAGGKTMTMADIQATASSSGKTPEEVRKAAIAAGYTIQ